MSLHAALRRPRGWILPVLYVSDRPTLENTSERRTLSSPLELLLSSGYEQKTSTGEEVHEVEKTGEKCRQDTRTALEDPWRYRGVENYIQRICMGWREMKSEREI